MMHETGKHSMDNEDSYALLCAACCCVFSAAVVYCAWWAMCPDEYPPVALCVVPLAAALMGYLTMLRRGPRS